MVKIRRVALVTFIFISPSVGTALVAALAQTLHPIQMTHENECQSSMLPQFKDPMKICNW